MGWQFESDKFTGKYEHLYICVCVNFLVQGLIHNCHPIIIMNIIQDIAYSLK